MGRFDALTELDDNQVPAKKPSTQPPEDTSPVLDLPLPQGEKKQSSNGKKPANRQTGKSINALQTKQDKFEKYSTYLRPGYKKILKNIANDRDCKSYEVLDEALTAFFEARNN
jgi:hypothetical protein